MESLRDMSKFWGNTEMPKIYVRSCGEFSLVPPDREECITPDFGEIFWPLQGNACFYSGSQAYTLYPGYVWYYAPGMTQNYWPLSEFHYCWLTIRGPGCDILFRLLNIVPGLNPAGVCPKHLFDLVSRDIQSSSQHNLLSALATAFKILTLIADNSEVTLKNGILNLNEIKLFIEDHCGDAELSIRQLAGFGGMHRASLSRAFRQRFGITVSEYLTICRIRKAEYLLKNSDSSLGTIAQECGFSTPQYFSKVFIRLKGQSPLRFRKL